MMSEAIDDALDNDEAEEETEELTNQVKTPFFFLILLYLKHREMLRLNDTQSIMYAFYRESHCT